MVGSDARRDVGRSGEAAVAQWYRSAGYEVLDLNWRVREGEIDLVAQRAGALVFCEVKTRRSAAYGLPVEAVTLRKQQRLRMLAARWLDAHDHRPREIRFDVASVTPNGRGWDVEVLEYAF